MKLLPRYILILVLLSLFAFESFSQDAAKFDKGTEEYSSGNYKEALDSWLEIYNTGYRAANLHYNIGNAYFKLQDIPNAILFYERAFLLDPADENINYNLGIARSLTVDRFQEIPEFFFVKWFNFIALILHGNTWGIISLIAFILWLVCLSVYIYSSRYMTKVLGFWFAIFTFSVSVASISFSWQNQTLVYDSHKAIIMDPLVSGKSSPDTSGTDLFVLHEGTKVSVGEEVGEWYEIRLSDGNKGWVPVSSLSII